MSNSDPTGSAPVSKIQLTMTVPDEAAEITLIDGSFHAVASSPGQLSVSVKPGIYKIKLSAGNVVHEEMLALPPDQPTVGIRLQPLPFASSVPARETAWTHEYHEQAAATCSREVHVQAGGGSYIFLMARDYGIADTRRPTPTLSQNPALDLALLDADGQLVVDFTTGALKGPQILSWWEPHFDPVAACNVALNPGIYFLRLALASGETIRQTVVAAPGWQTQVFLMQRNYGSPPEDRRADLANAGILMAEPTFGFDPSAEGVRLAELARLGLAGGRKVMRQETMEFLLKKPENPMLGIQGAHLLLMDSEPNLDLLDRVVGKLRSLLVGPHPDVEALALRLPTGGAGYIFDEPPMLRRSWELVVEASIRRPELVPIDSTAAQMAGQMWGDRPWLLWRSPAPRSEAFESFAPGRRPAPADPTRQEAYVSAVQSYIAPSAVSKDISRGLVESAEPGGEEEQIQRLVHSLGLPRANVEALYREAQSRPPVKRRR